MIYTLKQQNVCELAVGVEFDTEHLFRGVVVYTVLISTRHHDYIIDVNMLQDETVVLNELFGDSNILKVVWSSGGQVDCLKDLDLCLVNVFDVKLAENPSFQREDADGERDERKNWMGDRTVCQKQRENDQGYSFCIPSFDLVHGGNIPVFIFIFIYFYLFIYFFLGGGTLPAQQ